MDADELDLSEEGCGFSWDHTIREVVDGCWTCEECGAEGCDEEDTDDA